MICKNIRISESWLDFCMTYCPAQFQVDVLSTAESRLRKAPACPKQTRINSTNKDVKQILGRINTPYLPNGQYQMLKPFALPDKSIAKVLVQRSPRQRSPRRGRAHSTRPRQIRWYFVLAKLFHPLIWPN